MKTHVHDFFQIFSGGGHPTTAKKRKFVICGSKRGRHPKKSEKKL